MSINHRTTSAASSEIEIAEKIALRLEGEFNTESYDEDLINKLQLKLDELANVMIDQENIDPKTYILFETQALLHLIKGDMMKSRRFIIDAFSVKGNNKLFTKLGQDLLEGAYTDNQEIDAESSIPIGVRVTYFIIVTIFSLVGLLILLFDKRYSDKEKFRIGLPALILSISLSCLTLFIKFILEQ